MSQIKLLLVTVAVCLVVESASAAVYKITDYGATADGTTDCSPAIGAAIAAATAAGGGQILLPPADKPYLITDSIRLETGNLHIVGEGATVYLKDGSGRGRAGADDMLHIIRIQGTPEAPIENVSVSGLKIDANYWGQIAGAGSWQTAAKVAGTTRGIMINHARTVTISDVSIHRPFVGMTFGLGAHDCEARNVIVTGFHHDGFGVTPEHVERGASNIVFRNCVVADSLSETDGGPSGGRIKGWEIEEGAQDVKLIDCEVRNTSANGFYVRPHGGGRFATGNVEMIRCRTVDAGPEAFSVAGYTHGEPVRNVRLIDCRADDRNLTVRLNSDDVTVKGGTFGSLSIGFYTDYEDEHHYRDKNTEMFEKLPARRVVIEDVTITGEVRINATPGHDGAADYLTDVTLKNVTVQGDMYIVGDPDRVKRQGGQTNGITHAVTMDEYLRPIERVNEIIGLSTMSASRCRQAPTIDGLAGDAAWESAVPQEILYHCRNLRIRDVGRSFVRLCHDEQGLNLLLECLEPNMAAVRTGAKGRDADLWYDDCIEVFIHRDADAADYFRQWMVSAAGVLYDGDKDAEEKWDSAAKAAAVKLDDRYVVEMAIPWSDLGGPPKAGETLRANFIRNRTTDSSRWLWSWQYDATISFRDVAKMGTVVIEGLQD